METQNGRSNKRSHKRLTTSTRGGLAPQVGNHPQQEGREDAEDDKNEMHRVKNVHVSGGHIPKSQHPRAVISPSLPIVVLALRMQASSSSDTVERCGGVVIGGGGGG